MMRVRDADLGIGAAAHFPGQHERADARQVGLIGQRQQVHHQLGVLGVVGRDAQRLIDHRQLASSAPRPSGCAARRRARPPRYSSSLIWSPRADGPLEVRRARRRPRRECCDPAACARSRAAASVLPARAEQPLEHRARIVLDRQRRGRRAPGDGVRVGAARAAVARAEHRVRLDAELERRELRFLARTPVRRADPSRPPPIDVGAGGQLERHAGQEGAGGPRVIASALDQVRGLVVQAAAQEHLVLEGRQRLQRRRQLRERPFGLREPVRHRHAVGHVEDTEAPHGRGGRPAHAP